MSSFDRSKRDLYHEIEQEVRDLEAEFYGLAPINILIMNLEEQFSNSDILNGIDELISHNVINMTNDKNYLRSCY